MLPNMTSMSNTSPLVLMVEDEALVRLSGAGILIDAGFRTIEAVNGAEALQILEGDADVQLLFTDVNMPGPIDGFALARQVYNRWPNIGIMIASGRSMPTFNQLPAGCRFYRKPYSPQTVQACP
jgi:CheY-like chemotaxis protein